MKRLLLLAGLAAAGCSTTPDGPSNDPDWKSAEEAYLSGDFNAAAARFQKFVSANPKDDRVPQAKLRIGRSYLALGNPARALQYLDEVLASGPGAALEGDAHAARGMAFHGLGSPSKAESEFQDALRTGGDEVRRDECLWYLGLSRIRQSRWDEGLGDLGVLLKDHPDSSYAARAKALRAQPDRAFSIQAGAFSDPAGARRRSEELKAKGYEPEIVPDGGFHCVRVGRFTSWREAQNEAAALEAAGFETAVVP